MAIENSEKEAMKNAIKEALAEELQEHRQFFHDLQPAFLAIEIALSTL